MKISSTFKWFLLGSAILPVTAFLSGNFGKIDRTGCWIWFLSNSLVLALLCFFDDVVERGEPTTSTAELNSLANLEFPSGMTVRCSSCKKPSNEWSPTLLSETADEKVTSWGCPCGHGKMVLKHKVVKD